MEYIYSWVPAYKEIVKRLPDYQHRQPELIQVLRDIGVNVNEDEDAPGNKVPLSEIDPFSFLFFLGKPKNDWNKVQVLRRLCVLWGINVGVNDVCGIPTANAQKLWMFPWQYARTNEIDRLWDFFSKATDGRITDADFLDILNVEGVGPVKITEALFLTEPSVYMCLNSRTKPFLSALGFDVKYESFSQYTSLCATIRQGSSKPFHELSFEGYIESEHQGESPRYFRLGTREGENGESQILTMRQNRIASIGWPNLENLYEISELNQTGIRDRLLELGYCQGDRGAATRKAKEILLFFDKIRHNDYIIAADGLNVLAIGRVIGDHYVYDSSLNFPHCRCVNWIIVDLNMSINEGLRTTVFELTQESSIESILQILSANAIPNNMSKTSIMYQSDEHPLNRILYGPPGTGKTYQSISYAVAVVDNRKVLEVISEGKTEDGRRRIKDRFDELSESGNIVFTTFHQSMGYEDFIEGIKPLEPSPSEPMQYDVIDGIFKKICNSAEEHLVDTTTISPSFEEVLEKLEADWRLNPLMPFKLTRDGSEFTLTEFKTKNIPFKKASGGRAHSLSKKTLKDLYLKIREKYPSGLKIYYQSFLEKLNEVSKSIQPKELEQQKRPNRFVLIIDEINRGNVSQIFGELITLIEAEKRLKSSEELTVKLPYSGENFGVPPNVFIIGTMNTADRSVEALDTALRRRFSFMPMMPEYTDLPNDCEGVDIQELLRTMNKRLTVLKDKDHTIGHAWLWNVNSLEALRIIFKDKIIPLLQEFFYNDYEKLGLVLGEHFVVEEEKVDSNLFASFDGGMSIGNQYQNKRIYTISSPSQWTKEAFQSIYA